MLHSFNSCLPSKEFSPYFSKLLRPFKYVIKKLIPTLTIYRPTENHRIHTLSPPPSSFEAQPISVTGLDVELAHEVLSCQPSAEYLQTFVNRTYNMSDLTPGRLAGKKKWLVTRYPKPPGTLLILGSILTDPEDPETSLNRKTGVVKVSEMDKIDDSAAVRQQIHSELSSNVGALLRVVPPSSLLFSAGLKAEGQSSNEVKTSVEAMNVGAEIFLPDKAYMDEALGRPEIATFLKSCAWSESLYMIVGVATAEKLELVEEQSQESTMAASANATLGEIGTGFAAELSHGTMAGSSSIGKIKNATDFAYRVRESRTKEIGMRGPCLGEKRRMIDMAMMEWMCRPSIVGLREIKRWIPCSCYERDSY
jgi:hypothetical protein